MDTTFEREKSNIFVKIENLKHELLELKSLNDPIVLKSQALKFLNA